MWQSSRQQQHFSQQEKYPLTRRYLPDSAYLLPKDAQEASRLGYQHYACLHAVGNHYVAPLSLPLPSILDVGSGSNVWVREMATLFPHSRVVGVDLLPNSSHLTLPLNCQILAGDVLTGLPFPDASFSYVHQRFLFAAIPANRWPAVLRELARVTGPHGWVELVEFELQMQGAGPAATTLQTFVNTCLRRLGFDGDIVTHLDDLLQQAGLTRVERQLIPIPVGAWGGHVGVLMEQNLLAATQAAKERYCQVAQISGSAFDQILNEAAAEWKVTRPFCMLSVVIGKRSRYS
jgi:hypothetical protein